MQNRLLIIKKHPIVSFLVLAFLINWLGIALNVAGIFPAFGQFSLNYEGHEVALFRGRRTLLNWAPNFAAIIVLLCVAGWQGVADVFRKFLIWSAGWKWWMASIFIPIGICISAIGLYGLFGGTIDIRQMRHLPAVFGMRFLFSLSLGSIGEEAGWRGFALPGLQERFSPSGSAVLLGVILGLWHIPGLMIRPTGLVYFPYFFISVICLSILLAWIYNSTKSLLMVSLFHNTLNAVDAALAFSFASVVPRVQLMPFFACTMIFAALLVVWKTKGRIGMS